jgi:hypothetical protein
MNIVTCSQNRCSLLGNDSVNTFPLQRIRKQQSNNFRCYAESGSRSGREALRREQRERLESKHRKNQATGRNWQLQNVYSAV